MADFSLKTDNRYSAAYRNGKTGFTAGYYTAKQMKGLFPSGGVRVVGQLGYGKESEIIGSLTGATEPVYMVRAKANKKVSGYIELENGTFVTVKKDITAVIVILVILALAALAGLVFGIVYAVRANANKEPETTKPYGELAGEQEEGFGKLDLPEKADVASKNVTIIGIPEMHLKAGQLRQNFILTNSDKNNDICFMEFTFYIDNNGDKKIDDGDEQIYKSGLVRPGYSISEFSLNRELQAGEYKGLVMEQPYTYDKQRSPLNNMVMATTIVVD